MTLKTTKLRDAITFALVAGTTAAAGTGMAFAQEIDAQEQATTLDRIEVTGSRIRQVDVETAQPVLTINRADIERQGFQSVADILQNISATGTPPVSRAAPLSAGEASGGVFISLRNLGAARTLVLVNGKRLGITTGGLSDISTIPAVAVERIEVLKDGASSIYGSDAIAGVINIITRSNFEGATANAYYGQYSEGDGSITRGDFIIGMTGDRGSLTVAAEWTDEADVMARDRPYSAFPRSHLHPTDNWTAVGEFGGFVTTDATPIPGIPTGTRVVLRPGGDARNPADYVAQNLVTGSCTPSTTGAPGNCVPGVTQDKSNANYQMTLRQPIERESLYVDGNYDITENIRFRTNLLYSHRVSQRDIAGYPMQAGAFATPMSADSYFNPTGATISNWWRRTWEQPRVSESDLTTYRFSGAFEGSFEVGDRYFDWDVSYLHNNNRLTQSAFGNLNLANTRAAVGPSFLNAAGQVQCGTALNPIPLSSCVPWNPFVPSSVTGPGALAGNEALQDFLFQEEHSTGETKTTVISANLAGQIVAMPAGDLAFAVGVENRKEEGAFTPDALSVTGGSTNLAAGPTQGEYNVDEIYLELQVPLLADVPFAQELTLDLASRYSDYDTFGDTTNNKFGLKWKPFDSLLVRATRADGFRAPTIANLYGGGSQTFDQFTDPCDVLLGQSTAGSQVRTNCANGVGGNGALGGLADTYRQLGQGGTPVGTVPAQTPIAFVNGSNPLLTPELAESKTLGLVWSPGFLERFNMSVDWWEIRIDDTIVADSPTTILNDCYVQGIASRCSSALFTRDPVTGTPLVTYGSRNAGYREVEGYDVDFSYRYDMEDWGDLSFALNSTYTVKDVLISTNDPRYPISSVGTSGNSHRIRSNFNATWELGDFGFTWMARYFSGMKEACTYFTPSAAGAPLVTEPHLECDSIEFRPNGAFITGTTDPASSLSRRRHVGSHTFNDVQVRWTAPWNATIAIGANNVFDKQPAVMYSQPNSNFSFNGEYDIGRFVYMKYQQRF